MRLSLKAKVLSLAVVPVLLFAVVISLTTVWILQGQARTEGTVNLTFTTGRRDAQRAAELMRAAQAEIRFEELRVDEDVAKVSVVGVGMRSHAGVAQTMFKALSDKGVKFQAISTSEIKISVLIDAAYAELAVRALHSAYGLEAV